MRKLLWVALLAIVAVVCLLVFLLPAFAQQAPVITPQVNSTYYVKQVSGFYATIQATVGKACSMPGATVDIPAGTSPTDTIAAVTGGCTTAKIVDERDTPATTYQWNGSQYIAVASGGGAVLPTNAMVFGLSPATSRAATATDVQNVVKTATGCNTPGNTWEPQSGTCIPGSGSMSGQTQYSLPQATSINGSTVSSRFFEAADHSYSGLNNPFLLTAAAPNCTLIGPTFTRWGCHNINTFDDASSYGLTGATAGLAGLTINHNAWGGHAGFGGFEGRTSQVYGDSFNAAIVTAGIKQIHASNTSTFGIGDTAVEQNDHLCLGGAAYGSDEGCKFFYRIGETAPAWNAVITGGTNTAPTSTSSGGCFGLENQACAPIPGGWMIDASVGLGAGHGTGLSSGGPGSISWVGTVATDFAPTASTAWGYAISVNLTPNTSWEAPVSQTFTLQGGAGTFAVGDHACMLGSNFTEQNIISAVSGSSPTQTITMPLVEPETSVAIFKGDCMLMSFDAASAVGIQYGIPAVSIDGSHILASSQGYGNNVPLAWSLGEQWWTLDGGARSGIHLYAGSRITYVETTSTNPGQSWAPGNQIPHLMPNSAFSVGDTMISAHYETQLVTGFDLTSIQNMPGGPLGVSVTLTGHGISGSSYAYFGWNPEPTSSYIQYGGPLSEPLFTHAKGLWDTGTSYDTAPLNNVAYVANHQTGQTSYNIFNDNTWGTFSIASDGFHFNEDVFGNSYWGSGITKGGVGLVSGPGDGAGNHAGVEFDFPVGGGLTPTFLAPCNVNPFTGVSTDLCVTSQGNARSTYVVTADRNLQASTLSASTVVGESVIASRSDTFGAYSSVINPANSVSWAFDALGSFYSPNRPGCAAFFNNSTSLVMSTICNASFSVGSGVVLGFASGTDAGQNANDTGISRCGAGHVCIGNGTPGSQNGELDVINAVIPEFSGSSVAADRLVTKTTANSDLAGFLTMVGGTASYTFGATYFNSPACVASDTTAINPVQAVTTNTTLTVHGTGTDTVSYICVTRQ